jgi:signal transduction histidine kinase
VRRRLLVLAVSLVGLVLVALTVPLTTTFAEDSTQDQFVRRLTHLNRFAVTAQGSLESGEATALDADVDRYAEVYGGSVTVVDANRAVVASSTEGLTDGLRPVVADALVGRTSLPPEAAWPWSSGEMTLATPVGRDAEVLGAVVMVAPTDPVQDAVAGWLLWLSLGAVAVLGLTVFGVVIPFVGWVMRPVDDLDAAARRLAAGDVRSRAHQLGPPELRRLAHSFNSMADSVETSQRQQRDLVADAAHQLGNPLTALRLRIEDLGVPDPGADRVGAALEEADRLDGLVHALLDLSRVGADAVAPEERDVVDDVRRRCELWEPVFETLELRAPDEVTALVTPGLVDLVLDALLDNAAKFAPTAPVTVAVTQAGTATAPEVVLAVRDRGPGLPADDVGKVGDRFFRGRTHQNVPGTGLGLAIVRARVADVGGRLEVRGADGGGLEVRVVLRPGSRGST